MTWESDSENDSEFCKRNVSSCEFHWADATGVWCVCECTKQAQPWHARSKRIHFNGLEPITAKLLDKTENDLSPGIFSAFLAHNECVWSNSIQLEWNCIIKRHRWKMKNIQFETELVHFTLISPALAFLATTSIPTIFTRCICCWCRIHFTVSPHALDASRFFFFGKKKKRKNKTKQSRCNRDNCGSQMRKRKMNRSPARAQWKWHRVRREIVNGVCRWLR